MAERKGYALNDGDGERIWFAGSLVVLKALGEQTEGRLAAMDQKLPPGYTSPLHRHNDDDEAWYVLEGDATFFCGDDRFVGAAGAWVYLPKLVPHAFRVGARGARLLTLSTPAGFADFVKAAGEPAPALELPPAEPLDIARLAETAQRFGIELLGPAPD